jgi:hypothetical protein
VPSSTTQVAVTVMPPWPGSPASHVPSASKSRKTPERGEPFTPAPVIVPAAVGAASADGFEAPDQTTALPAAIAATRSGASVRFVDGVMWSLLVLGTERSTVLVCSGDALLGGLAGGPHECCYRAVISGT